MSLLDEILREAGLGNGAQDPYAALRTLNLQQGPGTQTPMIGSGDSQEWSGQMMDMPGAWNNPDWRSPELASFHRKGDTYISDRGDGTLEVSGLQYPGGSRRDQLRALYGQDPATGKWMMQGEPQLYKDTNRGWDKAKTPAALAAMILSAGAAGGAFAGAGAAGGSGAAPAAASGIKTLPGAASLGTMPAPLSPIVTGGALAPMAQMPAWVAPATLGGGAGAASALNTLGSLPPWTPPTPSAPIPTGPGPVPPMPGWVTPAALGSLPGGTDIPYRNEGNNYPTPESTQPGGGQGGAPGSPSGADWLSQLLGGDLTKLIGPGLDIAGGLYGKNLAEQARERSDPFARYRPGYGERLQQIEANPQQVFSQPGWRAGLDAVSQGMGAAGYLGSGNMAHALRRYGSDFYQSEVGRLAGLAGAGQTPGAGQFPAAGLTGSSMGSVGYGIADLLNLFGGRP